MRVFYARQGSGVFDGWRPAMIVALRSAKDSRPRQIGDSVENSLAIAGGMLKIKDSCFTGRLAECTLSAFGDAESCHERLWLGAEFAGFGEGSCRLPH